MRLSTPLLLALPSSTLAIHPGADFSITDLSKFVTQLLSFFPSSSTIGITPQIINSALPPIQALLARSSPVKRNGTTLTLMGEQWTASGANVYWLGLDENVIPAAGEPFYAPFNASYPTKGRTVEVMSTLVTMGAKLIRSQTLGVSTGNPLSLMPALGEWNEDAFEAIDWAVYQAREHGLRIIAPLTDNYDYYHGGKFNFLRWGGINVSSSNPLSPQIQQFYTNPNITSLFKTYTTRLLTHINPYTGLSYASDPTIIGYETGNELGGPVFGDMNVPATWAREICQLIKKLGPEKLCIDGTYGINSTHFEVKEVDVFSDHFYPLNNTRLNAGIDAVEKADRVYLAGELAWTEKDPKGNSLASFLDVILARQKSVKPTAAGALFWSLFGRNVPDCSTFVEHNDGFTLQYNNPKNSNATNTRIATIRQHFWAMQNKTVSAYLPDVPCPRDLEVGSGDWSYY